MIRSSGRSAVVVIPPDVMRSLEWQIGDEIMISVTSERAIIITKN
jgi:antitoxin component of MazEF toxin-antitoxin module